MDALESCFDLALITFRFFIQIALLQRQMKKSLCRCKNYRIYVLLSDEMLSYVEIALPR